MQHSYRATRLEAAAEHKLGNQNNIAIVLRTDAKLIARLRVSQFTLVRLLAIPEGYFVFALAMLIKQH